MNAFEIFLISIGSLILFIILIIFGIHLIIDNSIFGKRNDGVPSFLFQTIDSFPGLTKKFISIKTHNKSALNGAIFSYASNKYIGTIIFYHGLKTGYQNYLGLIEYFAKKNYLVVAFDFHGNMTSEGKKIKGMPIVENDAELILNYVTKNNELNKYPIFTLGHSWGGHTAMTSLLINEKVKKSCAFNPYNSNVDCSFSLYPKLKIIGPFMYLYYLIRFGYKSTYKVCDAIRLSEKKKMIICGGKDEIVKSKYAYNKYAKIVNEYTQLIFLKDYNHMSYLEYEASKYYAREIMNKKIKNIDFSAIDYKKIHKLNTELLEKIDYFFKN